MRITFILLLLLGTGATTLAQKLVYGLYNGNDRIGEFNVAREVNSGIEKMISEGEVIVTFIWTFRIHSRYEVWNDERGMFSSSAKGMRDQKITDGAYGRRSGDEYITIADGETVKALAPVTSSVLGLYYQEPGKTTRVFSERRGVYLPIEHLEGNRYELTTYAGRPAVYTYEGGIPAEIVLSTYLGTVTFRLERGI